MPKAFSKDLRERIVKAYNDGKGTIADMSDMFNVSKESVNKFLKISRTTGDLTPGQSTGRPPFLTENRLKIIKQIVLSAPEDRLEDYCVKFKKETGLYIPKSTLWDACQILNIRRKKKFFCSRTRTL